MGKIQTCSPLRLSCM